MAIHNSIARYQSSPTYPMLVRLEMTLRQVENIEQQAKRLNNGEAWYRAWKRALDVREQIALLKSVTR